MYKEVMQFNKERNQLDWNFDNELLMLREEIREFWDAETVAQRMDALVDTEFVWIGTQMKASYAVFHLPDELVNSIRQSLGVMGEVVSEELGKDMAMCYHNARKIVCECNAMKGKELDDDGKVIKGKIRDATKEIALMIESVTAPKSY